jgi:hypothetical protein
MEDFGIGVHIHFYHSLRPSGPETERGCIFLTKYVFRPTLNNKKIKGIATNSWYDKETEKERNKDYMIF